MKYLYGDFSEGQIKDYKKYIRKCIFWLIQYSDPKTKDGYPTVNLEKYLIYLIKQISGFNSLMNNPKEVVEILSTLQSALDDIKSNNFDFKLYRTMFLDAGDAALKIKEGD